MNIPFALQLAAAITFNILVMAKAAAEPTLSTAPSFATAKSLSFDGQTLNLAWEGGTADAPIREYIPAGENLDKWTHLASVREYVGREWADLNDPRELAAGTLETVKQTYPGAPHNMAENPDTGETVIDFLVGPPDGSFVEYNVFKYSKRLGGGVIAQQYAVRNYDNPTEFADKELPAIRGRVINEMATDGLQIVK
jgi:hypothetical protein